MPGRRQFLKDFYAKYAPDQQLSEERLGAIDSKYQDDHQLVKDLYSKYAPNETLPQERIDAISKQYELGGNQSTPLKADQPQNYSDVYQDPVLAKEHQRLGDAKIEKEQPGFLQSMWSTVKSGVSDQLPKEYYTQRLRMSKGVLGDVFDHRHDINAFGDQLEKIGVSRDEFSKWNFKQDDKVRKSNGEEKAKLFLTQKFGAEGYDKIKKEFEEHNQNERVGFEKEIQNQNQEATDKTGKVVQDLRDINSGKKLLSFLGNSIGQALYRIPTSLLTGTTGSIVSESSAIYDRQLDLISQKTGKSRENIIKEGLDKPAAGQALSVLAGGLDAVSAGGVLGIFRKAASKQLTTSFLKELPKQFVKGGLFEGVTEGTQGEIEEKAATNGANTDYVPDAWRIATGFVGGFVGGGGLDMVSSIVGKYRNNEGTATPKTNSEPIQRNEEQPTEQNNPNPVQQSPEQIQTTQESSNLTKNTDESGIQAGHGTEPIPSGGEQKSNGGYQKTAEDVVTGVHRAVQENGGKQETTQVRKEEEVALEKSAKENGTWIENPKKEFGENPHAEGTEQVVYFSDDGKKATKINSGVMHGTWKEFLERIAAHNKLFPDVPYTLKGFTNHNGDLAAVVEQPFVKGDLANYDEIKNDLEKKGFKREGDDPFKITTFHNPELGVTLRDVHDNNVIKDEEGNMHYIDTMVDPYDKELQDSLKEDINPQNPEATAGETINQPTNGEVNQEGRQDGIEKTLLTPEEVANKEQPLSNGPIPNESQRTASESTGTQQNTDQINNQEPPPPGTTQAASEVSKEKERMVAKRYLADPDVSDEIKAGLSQEGRKYIPTTDLKRQAEADAYIEEKGIDQSILDITDPENGMSDDNRVFVGKTIYKQLKSEVKKSDNPDAVRDKINRVMEDIAKMGTRAGQTVQAFANIFTSDADQVAYTLKKEYDKNRNQALEYNAPQLQNLQKLIDQATDDAIKGILNDPRIRKLIEESRANENTRQSKRKQFTQKILSKLDEIEKQIDDSVKGGRLNMDLSFGLAPLVYKAAINTIRVAVKAGDSLIDAIEKAIKEVKTTNKDWDEKAFREQFSIEVKQEEKRDRKTILDILSEDKQERRQAFSNLAEEHYKNYNVKKESIIELLQSKLNIEQQEAERLGNVLDRIVGEKRQKLIEQKFASRIASPKTKRIAKQLSDKIQEFTNLGVLSDKKMRDSYLEAIGLPAITEEQSREMEKMVEKAEAKPEGFQRFEAVQDIIKYHQKITPLNWMSVVESIWYANMLSGLSTHKVNFEANAIRTLSETFVSIVQSVAEYKKPSAVIKNTAFMLQGLVDGYKRNLMESANVLRNGYTPIKENKFDSKSFAGIKTSQSSILEVLDTKNPLHLWKYVGRLLAASDILFYGGLKHMRAHQLAFRDAYNQNQNTIDKTLLNKANDILGRTNTQLESAKLKAEEEGLTGRDKNRRVYEIMEQSWAETNREDANNFAAKGTYNYDPQGVMGIMTGVINNATSKIPILKTVVPFSRVISNVVNDYLDYTPWGLIRAAKVGMGIPNKPSYIRYSPEELLREKIKAVAGTTAMIGLYAMSQAKEDGEEPLLEITSDGTGNYKNNFELGRTGWKEYTAKIKGTNVRFDYRNTQLAIPFAVIGYINDAKKYKNAELNDTQLGLIFSGTFHFISDLSFLSGLSDFFEILTDEKEIGSKLVKFVERTAKTAIIPGAFTQVSRSIQEITKTPMRRGDSFYGQIFRDLPVLRDKQGLMHNTLGEPIIAEQLYKFNPMKMSTMADEKDKDSYKVWQLIVDSKAYIGSPSKATKIYDPSTGLERTLTPEEYDKYALDAAKYTKEMLLMDYDNLANEKDQAIVKDRIYQLKEQARDRAKSELFQTMY